jgi:hypothetical protein
LLQAGHRHISLVCVCCAALSLQELGLSMPQFIDLCIMCGCDYANNIRGIGAVRALNLIKQHGSVEAAVAVSRLPGRLGVQGCALCRTEAYVSDQAPSW